MKRCPGCAAPIDGPCPACGGHWLPHEEVQRLGPLGPFRRLAGKGPLTRHACADCGGPLKSLDVPGPVHEGDLFWGHESSRPAGTSVADACPRCGGVFVSGADLARAGGEASFRDNLARVMAGAS